MTKYKMVREGDMFRIFALRQFGDVAAGTRGGLIAREENLSHYGNAWVSDNARVTDNAQVIDDALVYDQARVGGHALLSDYARAYGHAYVYGHARLSDNARAFDHAQLADHALVYGKARVFGYARVSDHAQLFDHAGAYGHACVSGDSRVYSNAWVSGDARLTDDALVSEGTHLLQLGPLGSRGATLTIFRTRTGHAITTGCFTGTLDQFAVRLTGLRAHKAYHIFLPALREWVKTLTEENHT
jgi:UDP-3-O-[3-hydroxymyristoyl] glucosamine N-acyltransferase